MRTNGFQGQVTTFCKVETYATKAGYFRREVITYMLLLILSHQKTLLPVEHYLNSIHEKNGSVAEISYRASVKIPKCRYLIWGVVKYSGSDSHHKV